MEIKKEVKTYLIDCVCEECGEGKMRPDGRALMTSPIKYTHVCNNCGHEENFKITYPHTIDE